MKISHEWLTEFIDWKTNDSEKIADRLTRSTGEVDDVTERGRYLDGVVVGKVTNLKKHPQADRLSVCDVETGTGTKHIVCGGTNLKEGMLVAFAGTGITVLAGGKEEVTLAKVKIRGEESEGMICAAEEVEIEAQFPPKPEDGARPVADLTATQLAVGTALKKALGIGGVTYHVDNHAITNRPDLFSQIGIARECVALGLASWKKRVAKKAPSFPKNPIGFTLKNDAKELVPAYRACVIEVDGTAETPEWMKVRLEATGWRSINLVVDITNYVLMETGMPLHAFDADDFRGDVVIRRAKDGESVTTLDGTKRPLPAGAVVIGDDEGIFDLFGVMGGLRTSNKAGTKKIFLQAGIIDPVSVRRTMIAMAHRTDAGTVYEKGVTVDTAERGLLRAIELFLELVPGARVASKMVEWGKVTPRKPIKIDPNVFADVTGADITPVIAKRILEDLGFTVKKAGSAWNVTAPTWRTDIRIKEDLIEEVARIHGYDRITPAMPHAVTTPPPRDHRMNAVRDALKEAGFTEMLHLAFTSPAEMKKAGLDPASAPGIENPLGEELSLLRASLVPSLLETAGRETKKLESGMLRVFEFGRVFRGGKQPEELTLVVAAKGKVTVADEPVLSLKAALETAFNDAGYALTIQKRTKSLPPFAHAGRSATVLLEGKDIGLLFEVEPKTAKAFGLPSRTAALTLDMDAVKSDPAAVRLFTPIPAYPSVEFDETIPLPVLPFGDVRTKLRSADPLLKDALVLHLYEDAAGAKNVTLRFVYRAEDRTLTQEEAKAAHARVMAAGRAA